MPEWLGTRQVDYHSNMEDAESFQFLAPKSYSFNGVAPATLAGAGAGAAAAAGDCSLNWSWSSRPNQIN